MIKKIKLSEIVTDAGTQVRAGLNEATVTDYAEALAEGAKFPPVVVFHDGSRYIAADGFHRIHAAVRNGATQIECDVHKGSKSDALKFALGCNAHHGLRRTNADKRHAVELALREFPKASNVAIAATDMDALLELAQREAIDVLVEAIDVGVDVTAFEVRPADVFRVCQERHESSNGGQRGNELEAHICS